MEDVILLVRDWIVPCVALVGATVIYLVFSVAALYTGEDLREDTARSQRRARRPCGKTVDGLRITVKPSRDSKS